MAELPSGLELFSAFDGYFRLEMDLAALLSASRDLVAKVKEDPLPDGLAVKIARLLELAGRGDEAFALYKRDFMKSGSTDSLAAAARLCIEMNDLADAERILAGSQGAAAGVLAGQIALQRGDYEQARARFLAVANGSAGSEETLQAMYGLYAAAVLKGDSQETADARERLLKAFPQSPEAAIARSQGAGSPEISRIVLSPLPVQLLGSVNNVQVAVAGSRPEIQEPASQLVAAQTAVGQPPQSPEGPLPPLPTPEPPASPLPAPQGPASQLPTPEPSAPSPPSLQPTAANTPDKPSPKVSVQAGSYQVLENAEDMVSELKKRGFAAVVREEMVSGRRLFKALAGASLGMDEAKDVLARLASQGFEGFIVFEKQ